MRLNQMYRNVLSIPLEELTIIVEEMSAIRHTLLLQSMSKIDKTPKERDTPKLSDSEKAILKALGLKPKDIKALKESMNE
jgi:hypothetical protein